MGVAVICRVFPLQLFVQLLPVNWRPGFLVHVAAGVGSGAIKAGFVWLFGCHKPHSLHAPITNLAAMNASPRAMMP